MLSFIFYITFQVSSSRPFSTPSPAPPRSAAVASVKEVTEPPRALTGGGSTIRGVPPRYPGGTNRSRRRCGGATTCLPSTHGARASSGRSFWPGTVGWGSSVMGWGLAATHSKYEGERERGGRDRDTESVVKRVYSCVCRFTGLPVYRTECGGGCCLLLFVH